MTASEIIKQIKPLGKESYKKTLQVHGIPDPLFGVSIAHLKVFEKKIKKDYRLALDLYDSGIYDAMYLAGLIADETKMTKKDLEHWVKNVTCPALAEYTVAWVAAESQHGRELALKWIDSSNEDVATAGWATLRSLVSIKEDGALDLRELKSLLNRVKTTIHKQPNRVKLSMNGFVIALGCGVPALMDEALEAGEQIGKVAVDMGKTSCKVPFAPDYIRKVQARGTIGKKRKSARC